MICNYVAEEDSLFIHFEDESTAGRVVKVDPRCFVDVTDKDEVVSLTVLFPKLRWPILEMVSQLGPGFSLFQMLALEDLETKWQEFVGD
jgi:hypothetical protein